MRIISFDVGMKNLAYCVFSIADNVAFTGATPSELIHQIHIERWDVIDLRFPPDHSTEAPAPPPPKRTCINDGKLAKWVAQPNLVAPAQPNLVAPARSTLVAPSAPLASVSLFPATSVSHLGISGAGAGVGGGTGVVCGVGGGAGAGVGGGVVCGPPPILYCAKCAEKSKYITPSREILPIKRHPELLQKKKLGELTDIKANLSAHLGGGGESADAKNLKLRKSDLVQEITTILARDYLEPFDETKYASYIAGTVAQAKPKKANYTYAHDLDLITYGRNMMKHLDAILFTDPVAAAAASAVVVAPIDMMIIENQISTLASRMKTLQGMITQYFIMKNVPQIEFISASCKLKLFTDANSEDGGVDASTYADRKKSGILVCRSLGEISRKHNSDYVKWMPVFENHKKKDDLADCFLQGLWRVHLLATGAV
jgi:hypothetical protein